MTKFSISKRIESFGYAGKGIKSFLFREHNAWIHSVVTVLVVIAGCLFHITRNEWIAILLCVALVFAAEAFNTAIERLVNIVSPERNVQAGDVKDIAAGAVLICAIIAAIVGLIIFTPYILVELAFES
ncbi:MAG: diacylglycerol kinase family protein [Bacteroidaceae bacterium]